jgi:hypothetical protein
VRTDQGKETKVLPHPYITVSKICEKMGWDYFTYRKQPKEFLDVIAARMPAEADYQEYLQSKSN